MKTQAKKTTVKTKNVTKNNTENTTELKLTKKQREFLEMGEKVRKMIGKLIREGKMQPYEKS